MTTETFKVGDTVRLKSGGPLMTVTGVSQADGGQKVWTSWFDSAGKEQKGFYPSGGALTASDDSGRFAIA